MAETVSQHQTTTFTTPVNGTTADATVVLGNDNTLVSNNNSHDADPGIHTQSSALASRPAAGTAGRKWITNDPSEKALYYDNGSSWDKISGPRVLFVAGGNVTPQTGSTVEVSIASYTLPANALIVNGARLHVTAFYLASGAQNAHVSFKFGSVSFPNSIALTIGQLFVLDMHIMRYGSNAQQQTGFYALGAGAMTMNQLSNGTAETETSTILLDFRGKTDVGGGSLILQRATVDYYSV